jgi:hypothetical protein
MDEKRKQGLTDEQDVEKSTHDSSEIGLKRVSQGHARSDSAENDQRQERDGDDHIPSHPIVHLVDEGQLRNRQPHVACVINMHH